MKIKITSEYITLGQFLKFCSIISSGAMAKTYLVENIVYVNNEVESRRGRKLYPGAVVKVEGKEYTIE